MAVPVTSNLFLGPGTVEVAAGRVELLTPYDDKILTYQAVATSIILEVHKTNFVTNYLFNVWYWPITLDGSTCQ